MSNFGFRACSYLRHISHAHGLFSVHSPFVFELYKRMRQKSRESVSEELKCRLKVLKQNTSLLEYEDLGSRSGHVKVTVASLANNSLKPLWQAQRLAGIVEFLQPDLIIELGTSLGITTSLLHQACPKAQIVSVEGIPQIHALAKETMKNHTEPELLCGNFNDLLPSLVSRKSQKCFAFVDGNHRPEPTIKYAQAILPIGVDVQIIAIDDIHASAEMTKAWEFLCLSEQVQVSMDFYHFGLLIRKQNLSKEHFRLRL